MNNKIKCSKCGKEKSTQDFNKNKNSKNGYWLYCKPCDKERRVNTNAISAVYKITNPEGKVYIGESADVLHRWKYYYNNNCKSQIYIYNSILEFGIDNHTFEIIEHCDKEIRRCRERYWQIYYDVLGENGLNGFISECGDEKVIRRPEINERISASKMGMNTGADSHCSQEVIYTPTGEIYVSATEAFKYSGMASYDYFKAKLNGNRKNDTYFMYLKDFEEKGAIDPVYVKPSMDEVINTLTLKEYPSILQAAEAEGITGTLLTRYLSGGRPNRSYFVYRRDYVEGQIHYPQDGKKRRIVDENTNKVYYALHQLCEPTGLTVAILNRLLKEPEYKIEGINIRYYVPELDHDKEHVDTGKKKR